VLLMVQRESWKKIHWVPLLMAVTIWLGVGGSGYVWAVDDPVGPLDPSWSFEYRGQGWPCSANGSPYETPQWTSLGGGGGASRWLLTEGDDQYLRIVSDTSSTMYYKMPYPVWDADLSAGLTIEFRTRVAGFSNSTQFWFADNKSTTDNFIYCELRGDPSDPGYMREFWILANDGTKKYQLDTTQWHTYRLTTENSTVILYVDGNEVPVLTGQLRDRTDGANSIEFGDRSGTGDARFDLDYIRVYLDGAVTPSAANPYELVDSAPADGKSLPRTANNEIRLVFSRGIEETLPSPPLSITRIGALVDDANDFTYSLASTSETNDTLVATENGSILEDLTWYRVKPTGIWAKAFTVEMPTFAGDADGNGQVDLADYAQLSQSWAGIGPDLGTADLDGDEDVDATDLSLLQVAWGDQAPVHPIADLSFTKFTENPILEPATIDARYGTWHCCVRRKGAGEPYMMWYSGEYSSGRSIHLATSSDGINFTKQGIVMNPGWTGVDEYGAHMSSIMWHENQWKMWYTGIRNMGQPACENYGFQIIAYATSPDGYSWTKHGVVFDVDPNHDAFDAYSVRSPAVIYDADVYKMWYYGTYDCTYSGAAGYAESPDGINWTRIAQISDDTSRLINAEVLKINNVQHMWHNFAGSQIGYSISLDGIIWEDSPENPLISSVPGTWEQQYVQAPTVVYDADTDVLRLYYNGSAPYDDSEINRIGGAWSWFYPQ